GIGGLTAICGTGPGRQPPTCKKTNDSLTEIELFIIRSYSSRGEVRVSRSIEAVLLGPLAAGRDAAHGMRVDKNSLPTRKAAQGEPVATPRTPYRHAPRGCWPLNAEGLLICTR